NIFVSKRPRKASDHSDDDENDPDTNNDFHKRDGDGNTDENDDGDADENDDGDYGVDTLEDLTPDMVTAIRERPKGGRPKAGDYDEPVREVLGTAIELFRATLLSENPFPSSSQELEWAKSAWREACDVLSVRISPTGEVLKLITNRGSHLRGELKTKSKPVVANVFGFETSADEEIQEDNRHLVASLKEDCAFIYRERGTSIDEHKGIYGNKAIQQVINELLYKNKHDEGITWSQFYSPFPIVGLALVITACSIDEWASGSKTKVAFTEDEYQSVFEGHLESLKSFEERSNRYNIVPQLLQKISNTGRYVTNKSHSYDPHSLHCYSVHAKADFVLNCTS
ncbi:hypothetical protein BJ138DRAFT_965792, partial [Hygrophoropsis aurantiaca]